MLIDLLDPVVKVQERLLVEQIEDCEHLWDVLTVTVPLELRRGRVKLVIIDSIAAVCRGEFSNSIQGLTDRADVLLNSAAGASLRQANASGSVGGLLFCEWWLAEDVAEQLHSGLSKSFPSGLELLERSASNAFRYRLQRGEGGPLSLADVFGEVEDAKDALSVAEYAVGQTTLEQVFVEFASSQENPENR